MLKDDVGKGARPAVRAGFLAWVACSCWHACATTEPPPVHIFPAQRFDLPSGLQIIVEHDDVSQLIAMALVVEAGTIDDPVGREGTAHAVEHLAFDSADERGRSVWDRLLLLGAAGVNAHTGLETTVFHALVPREALDQIAAISLSLMADPLHGLSDEAMAKEQLVLAQEHQVSEARQASIYASLDALLPAGHPYLRRLTAGHPTVLTASELREFGQRRYVPQSMTLVISGPVPEGWERTLQKLLPATLAGTPGSMVPRSRRPMAVVPVTTKPWSGIERIQADVADPELRISWALRAARGRSEIMLALIGRVLNDAINDRITEQLLPGVAHASVVVYPGSATSILECRIVQKPATDPDAIFTQVTRLVEDLTRLFLPSTGRLHRSVVDVSALRIALDTESPLARALTRAQIAHIDPGVGIGEILDDVRNSPMVELANESYHSLSRKQARAVLLLPTGDAPLPVASAVSSSGTGSAADTGVPHGDDAVTLRDHVIEEAARPPSEVTQVARPPGAGAAKVTSLANGLTLIVLPRKGFPLASMIFGFHAAPKPGEKPPARFAAPYASFYGVARGTLERGLLTWTSRDHDSYREAINMFSSSFNGAVEHLAEEVHGLTVRWPSPRFERELSHLLSIEASPHDQAMRAFEAALLGGHPYGWWPRAAEIRNVTLGDVDRWFEEVRRPDNGVLIVVGDVNPQAVARQASRKLGDWKEIKSPMPLPAPPIALQVRPNPSAPRFLVAKDPRQRFVNLHFGCLLPPGREPRDLMVTDFVVTMMYRDLFRRARTDLDASYSPDVRQDCLRGGTCILEGNLDIEIGKAPLGIGILREWLDSGARLPEAVGSTLEETRWRLARWYNLRFATNESLARILFDMWNLDRPPSVIDQFPLLLAGVTRADLLRAVNSCRASGVISVVTPDPTGLPTLPSH